MTSTYETQTGTEPVSNGVHEPRTIHRVVTPDGRFDLDSDLHMMSEIGDGVFVQWSSCRKCAKAVGKCKCTGGPQEPEYLTRWHQDRFQRSFNERPEPSYDLLPSLIEWLEERGYSVTKADEPVLDDDDDVPSQPPVSAEEEEQLAPDEEVDDQQVEEFCEQDKEPSAELVNDGLDAALERVRAAKGAEDAEDVGF